MTSNQNDKKEAFSLRNHSSVDVETGAATACHDTSNGDLALKTLADVHETLDYSPEEEKRVCRKIDLCLLPLVIPLRNYRRSSADIVQMMGTYMIQVRL